MPAAAGNGCPGAIFGSIVSPGPFAAMFNTLVCGGGGGEAAAPNKPGGGRCCADLGAGSMPFGIAIWCFGTAGAGVVRNPSSPAVMPILEADDVALTRAV